MNISILGGCGFLGSSLADAFLAEDHAVTVFDHLTVDQHNIAHLQGRIRFVSGDFLNPGDVAQAIRDAELVVHAVSTTLPGSALKNPVYDIESNLVASVKLFEQCVKAGVRKLVFLSSGGTVYGIPQQLPLAESHEQNPITPYGLSKLAIEKYLALYRYHYGLDYVVLRLSNPYGKRQNPLSGQGVVAAWMHQARLGQPIEMWGDGSVVRDYLYIDDAVQAVKLAALGQAPEQVFNIGSGIGHSLRQIHETLQQATGCNIPVIHKEMRKVDVPVNILDVSRIRALHGWQAETSLLEGMQRMWQALEQG